MIKLNDDSTATRIRTVALTLLLSFLIVPVCAFIGGSIVVGAYEGNSGLFGYMTAIYGDALRGRWPAWIMILAPVLIVATWYLVVRMLRATPASSTNPPP